MSADSKAEPSYLMEKINVSLYLQSCFFQSLPTAHDHRWGLEGRWTVKSKALPSGSAPSLPQWSGAKSAVLVMLHQTTLGQELTPQLEGAIQCFLSQNHGLRLGGAAPHPDHFTFSYKLLPVPAGGHTQKQPAEPHHLQKADSAVLRFL